LTSTARIRAFLELGKLRLSSLVLFAVVAGLFIGSPDLPAPSLVLSTVLGSVLVAIGGNALNMYLERETDRRMTRTQVRPLPTGRLGSGEVAVFGYGTAAVGLGVLAATTNLIATGLCAAVFVTYVWIYTPLKRLSTLNTLVGAVPGALPPVVGYAAGAGHVDRRALILFTILFLWQIPHFLAIAWRYREEYREAGLQMMPVVDTQGTATGRQMMVYSLSLFLVSVLPSHPSVGMTGGLYLAAAIVLGIIFLAAAFLAAILRRPGAMRECFLVSIIYLPLLLTAMVTDRLLWARV
jgi:protoheme IX farnesyltransferase